MLDEPVEWG
jgi:hypothetical protein